MGEKNEEDCNKKGVENFLPLFISYDFCLVLISKRVFCRFRSRGFYANE